MIGPVFNAVCAVTFNVKDAETFCEGLAESLTFTVNEELPAVVGDPEIEPLLDIVNPAGNCPEAMLQRYGFVPPLAASAVLYALPTMPSGSEEVVIARVAGAEPEEAATLRVSDADAVFAGLAESLTLAVNDELPADVGVPEIVPALESARPAGNCPETMLHAYGFVPPVAASVAL